MLEHNEIKNILPHRYPFLLVDRIIEIEAEKRAVGLKNVTGNEHFFEGHFPNHPVMPGVLIIEALAQVGACAVLSKKENEGKLVFFGGIDKAKFRKQVVPGDQLRLEVEMTRVKGRVGKGVGKAYIDDEIAAEAELTFVIDG